MYRYLLDTLIEIVEAMAWWCVSRHGDNGYYLFFATTGLKLSNTDINIGKKYVRAKDIYN